MEVNLDLSLVYTPKTITEYLKEVSKMKNISLKLSKLDDYVKKLEEEMKKIDAFKRELPLCMLLLNDAIVRLKEEVMHCKEMEDEVLFKEKEFHGNNNNCSFVDKKEWMSSVQLWNDNSTNYQDSKSDTKQRSEDEDDRSTCENPIQLCNYGSKGQKLVPFKTVNGKKEEKEVVSQDTGLSLMANTVSELGSTCNFVSRSSVTNPVKVQNKPQPQSHLQQHHQQALYKKQRRSWSPELHRRFVDALQQLGGSQVATPKQIRELMQVDGLTNDEVKSHLQKYRLHIRKLPATSAAQANALWMAKNERKVDAPKQSVSHSNSPEGPFHGCGSTKGGMSSTGDESMDAEGDNSSESNSWNGRHQKTGEVDVQ